MKIVITGINQGLGKFLVQKFRSVDSSFELIGIDKIPEVRLTEDVKALLDHYICMDLSQVNQTLEQIEKYFGSFINIDLFINNAGIKLFKPFDEITSEEFINVFKVNALSPIMIHKVLLHYFPKIKIINISSNAGFHGYRTGTAYCSSKSAVIAFTEAVKSELKSEQRVYTLCPSTISTKEVILEKGQNNAVSFINPESIFSLIQSLINGKRKSGIIPVIGFKQRIKYVIRAIKRFFL